MSPRPFRPEKLGHTIIEETEDELNIYVPAKTRAIWGLAVVVIGILIAALPVGTVIGTGLIVGINALQSMGNAAIPLALLLAGAGVSALGILLTIFLPLYRNHTTIDTRTRSVTVLRGFPILSPPHVIPFSVVDDIILIEESKPHDKVGFSLELVISAPDVPEQTVEIFEVDGLITLKDYQREEVERLFRRISRKIGFKIHKNKKRKH